MIVVPKTSSIKTRVPELDGIRGMAILLVLIWHFVVGPIGETSSPLLSFLSRIGMQTWSGVDLFFVLSGFLIGGILVDAKGSDSYFRTFYIRRVFRILPIYVLICGGYFSLRAAFPAIINGAYISAMPGYVYAAFLQNFWLAHHPWNTFLDQSWSLAVEEQFYLTLPALIWFTPRRHLWKLISTLAIASVAVRSLCYLHYYPAWRSAAYTLVICRADALLLGVLAALAVRNERALAFLASRRYLLRSLALMCFAVVVVMTLKYWGMGSTAMSTVGYTCTALMYVSVLLMTVTAPGSAWGRIFRTAWLRWMGTIAYCLYLVHADVLLIVCRMFGYARPRLGHWNDVFPLATALAFSLLISHLSWKYFESGMVSIGHRFTYRRAIEAPLPAPRGGELAREAAAQ
jgi:peptidoglycan/LPS O-acetylase OafA/YrhL